MLNNTCLLLLPSITGQGKYHAGAEEDSKASHHKEGELEAASHEEQGAQSRS